jgi:excisionase family DNA binding protein
VTRGVVYFVEAEELGLVRFGATRDLPQRLATLTTENAARVRLVAALAHRDAPGYVAKLRRRFAAMHDHGDWFRPRAPLRAFLAELPPVAGADVCAPPVVEDQDVFSFDVPAPLLDVAALATYLQVSAVTVRRLVRARQLPCVRVGRQLRFDIRDPAIAARRRLVDLTRSS